MKSSFVIDQYLDNITKERHYICKIYKISQRSDIISSYQLHNLSYSVTKTLNLPRNLSRREGNLTVN